MATEHYISVTGREVLFSWRNAGDEPSNRVNTALLNVESILQVNAVRFKAETVRVQQNQSDVEGQKRRSKSDSAAAAVDDDNEAAMVKTSASSKMMPNPVTRSKQWVHLLMQNHPRVLRAQKSLISAMIRLNKLTRWNRGTSQKAVRGRFGAIDKHSFSQSMSNLTPDYFGCDEKLLQPPWFLIQTGFEALAQLYHPPLVAITMLKQRKTSRRIELHVFVCCSDSDAIQLVEAISNLAKGMANVGKLKPEEEPAENNNSPILSASSSSSSQSASPSKKQRSFEKPIEHEGKESGMLKQSNSSKMVPVTIFDLMTTNAIKESSRSKNLKSSSMRSSNGSSSKNVSSSCSSVASKSVSTGELMPIGESSDVEEEGEDEDEEIKQIQQESEISNSWSKSQFSLQHSMKMNEVHNMLGYLP